MSYRLALLILALAVFSAIPAVGQVCREQPFGGGPDLFTCDTVRIVCPQIVENAKPGDSIAVPIVLWFDEPSLAGFSLGFTYNSDDVEITSVSFENSIIQPSARINGLFWRLPSENRALVGWLAFQPSQRIPGIVGSHAELLFTLYMKILPSITPQTIDLDSSFVAPAGTFVITYAEAMQPVLHSIYWPEFVECGDAEVVVSSVYSQPNCGDVNGSGQINISDAIYLAYYLFGMGPAPKDSSNGDISCDGRLNLSDVVWIVNYIFGGGAAPCSNCGK